MTHLRVYPASDAGAPEVDTRDPGTIAAALAAIGVRFEQWPVRDLPADLSEQSILAAFAPEIDRLKAEGGYRKVDTIRLAPGHPDAPAMRGKFLSEHRHAEDEVRFFVEGEGLFTLHGDDERVYAVLCGKGDLISVPAGMRHWFDMGPAPSFVVIRLFTNPEGWVAQFTGDAIADRFPRHEPVLA